METHDTYSPTATLRDAAAARVRALELGQFTRRDILPLALIGVGIPIGALGNLVERPTAYAFFAAALVLTIVAVGLGARRIHEIGVNSGIPSTAGTRAPLALIIGGLIVAGASLPVTDLFDLPPVTPLAGAFVFVACLIVGSWWAARLAARRLEQARADLAALDTQDTQDTP